MSAQKTSVLFTGYAPVHFVCFRPLYERLMKSSEFDVFLSGGLRSESEGRVLHDTRAMYEPFGIPSQRILTVEENTILGGLGGAVAEICLEHERRPPRFRRLGIDDTFVSVVGDQSYLRGHVGIDRAAIVNAARALLARS